MSQSKVRVAVLMGGRSAEHEVSLQSARNILRTLDRERYECAAVTLDKHGVWRLSDASNLFLHADDPSRIQLAVGGPPVVLLPWPDSRPLVELETGQRHAVDVVFPVLHGPFGEDGTIQGLLDLASVPYVGAGVLGSAASMDKDAAKRLLQEAEVPVARGITLYAWDDPPAWKTLAGRLGTPLFIKPANLGSSVGVYKVRDSKELQVALQDAFRYDSKVLAEEFIAGREIECSVLGNEAPEASIPGEVIPNHEFYSYDAKYIDPDGAQLKIPAEISSDAVKKVRELAVRAFQALCCHGMARVDFFLTPGGPVVNEVNTIPGFTNISMYPKLWEATGLSQSKLLDRLIQLAFERADQRRQLESDFHA